VFGWVLLGKEVKEVKEGRTRIVNGGKKSGTEMSCIP